MPKKKDLKIENELQAGEVSDKLESATKHEPVVEDSSLKTEKKSVQKKIKSKYSKAKKRSYRYKIAKEKIDRTLTYKLEDAIKAIKNIAYANFEESVELHITLGTDPKNSDQRIRFTTTLPHGIGKSIKILVITDQEIKIENENVLVKSKDAINEILNGSLVANKDFDIVITSPSIMKELGKVAKILGPKGLMPSLKNNTITENFEKVISEFSKGQIEIKSQPNHAVIHQLVGKVNFEVNALTDNISSLINELNKNTPAKLKKKLIQKAYVKSTMGPSVRINA